MPEFTTAALIASMRHATEDVKRRAALLVSSASAGLVADHKTRMPRSQAPQGTPLADRVSVSVLHPWLHVVRSTAPHLHLVELGTEDRYAQTWRGRPLARPRFVGRMPARGPIFVPLAIRRRAEMLHEAEALLGTREL